jgi:hypothetical protein
MSCHDSTSTVHLAAHVGSYDAVVALLSAGADVNKTTLFEKNAPLHLVSFQCFFDGQSYHITRMLYFELENIDIVLTSFNF